MLKISPIQLTRQVCSKEQLGNFFKILANTFILLVPLLQASRENVFMGKKNAPLQKKDVFQRLNFLFQVSVLKLSHVIALKSMWTDHFELINLGKRRRL